MKLNFANRVMLQTIFPKAQF